MTMIGADMLELALVALLFVTVVSDCVAIGLTSGVVLFSKYGLKHTLRVLALPLAWLLALHVWEKRNSRHR